MGRRGRNTLRRARDWFHAAMEPAVVRRVSWYAVVVGAILVFINHGDALSNRNVDRGRLNSSTQEGK